MDLSRFYLVAVALVAMVLVLGSFIYQGRQTNYGEEVSIIRSRVTIDVK